MNKILIVIEREFSTRIRKKSFILLTILMPFLVIGVICLPILLAGLDSNKEIKVAVIDHTGQYAPILKDNGNLHFVPLAQMDDSLKKDKSSFSAVILISKDLSADSTGATIYSHKEVPAELTSYFNRTISDHIRDTRITQYQIPQLNQIISKCRVDYKVRTIKWTDEGEENLSSSEIAGLIGMLLTLLIYMFVLSYGGMVMQGVCEEKANRIMEIMVSSVKPFQLMMGKIIGVALVGIIQFAIWSVLIGIGMTIIGLFTGQQPDVAQTAELNQFMSSDIPMPNSPASEIMQIMQGINFGEILTMFVLYFLGGYLLFASFFAAIGASINEQSDSSQFMTPIVIIMIFSLYAGMFSINNPDGPLAMWCSLIPITSPIVMMVRLPFGVPAWQLILSLVLLYATAIGVVALSAKIYRVGILMYGKKPTFKEMMKWIKFK